VLDSDHNERFKNGIVVDTFHGGETGDIGRRTSPPRSTRRKELHVAFRASFAVQFAPDLANSTSFGVTLIGDMAIPSYNVSPFITQPLATHSISVNPFDVASFYGSVDAVTGGRHLEGCHDGTGTGRGPGRTDADMDRRRDAAVVRQLGRMGTDVERRRKRHAPSTSSSRHRAGRRKSRFRSMTELSWNDVTSPRPISGRARNSSSRRTRPRRSATKSWTCRSSTTCADGTSSSARTA
jgi:hypothetical protein